MYASANVTQKKNHRIAKHSKIFTAEVCSGTKIASCNQGQ